MACSHPKTGTASLRVGPEPSGRPRPQGASDPDAAVGWGSLPPSEKLSSPTQQGDPGAPMSLCFVGGWGTVGKRERPVPWFQEKFLET